MHRRTSPTLKVNTSKIEKCSQHFRTLIFRVQLAKRVGELRRASTITDGACTGSDVSMKSHVWKDHIVFETLHFFSANSSPADMIFSMPANPRCFGICLEKKQLE